MYEMGMQGHTLKCRATGRSYIINTVGDKLTFIVCIINYFNLTPKTENPTLP